MGLVVETEKEFSVLTDIVGVEDSFGDMDFKVAGSRTGITALQLDVKTLNLTVPILRKALAEAKSARLKILEVMESVIDKPRETVSKYAPKIKITRIDPDKIGDLIGPGGKTIRKIIAETGAQIDVDEDGTVYVSAITASELEAGLERVEAIAKVPLVGEVYEGVVKRVQPFGAFVEIFPGKEGLVHVSDMSENFVKNPLDFVKVGDKVTVRVKGIDDLGRLNLSMMLDPSFDTMKEEKRREGLKAKKRGGFGRGMGKFGRKSGGPHFPKSRYLEDSRKKF